MFKAVARSGQFGPFSKVTAQSVPPPLASVLVKATALPPKKPLVPTEVELATYESMSKAVASINSFKIVSGPAVSTQVRFAHTDVKVSDFAAYRRSATKDPTSNNKDSLPARNAFSYVFVAAGMAGAVYGGRSALWSFLNSLNASKDVMAISTVEVKLDAIPEGTSATFTWRGKPLFVRHRTSAEVAKERAVPLSTLRDPQEDADRCVRPDWLIVIGVCTHLGCVPIANAGDFGGYYCPCHGSHYDAAGRIRKGPAPLNLEVPKHVFNEDASKVLVG